MLFHEGSALMGITVGLCLGNDREPEQKGEKQ
jgi:hypothetical protein